MLDTVEVDLGDRSYPIHIGADALADRNLWERIESRQVVIVSNEVVAPLYLDQVCQHFSDRDCFPYVIADGEAEKNLGSFEKLMGTLLEQRVDRSATLVALGGGVVGDLTGFAAACYQRGIAYVQAPTTLLAQVDSSVGGKTAVNHPLGKNMIGAFYQPQMVIADTSVFDTLPDREFAAGLAEIIKYGLIRDSDFLSWLEENLGALVQRDNDTLRFAIRRSCENKAEVVTADERESGSRALLNLGHTFGHAIETIQGYGEYLHGEAVAIGMVMAARMSARCGWISGDDVNRVCQMLLAAGLPTVAPAGVTPEQYLEVMSRDKKNTGGDIRLVLLKSLGNAFVTSDYDASLLHDTLVESG